jgi:hypothetical protein
MAVGAMERAHRQHSKELIASREAHLTSLISQEKELQTRADKLADSIHVMSCSLIIMD